MGGKKHVVWVRGGTERGLLQETGIGDRNYRQDKVKHGKQDWRCLEWKG